MVCGAVVSDKTLGRVAFEAWAGREDGKPRAWAIWGEQAEWVHERWEAAAEAVTADVQSGLREMAKALEGDIDDMIVNPDEWDVDGVKSLLIKLYDAIMDPVEVKP